MKQAFLDLAGRLARELRSGEALLCTFSGEVSDFVRFNRGKVRQAGSVEQRSLSMRLVHDRRQASAARTLNGSAEDFCECLSLLRRLRHTVGTLPADPWLLVNETPRSTETVRRGALPPSQEVVRQVAGAARGRDLVGFYAGGTVYRGFACAFGPSLAQSNWHESDSFNFDWSLYREADQAVKSVYAGFDWDPAELAERVEVAAKELELMRVPQRRIEPGEYRAYLAPRALEELMGLLSWGAFSARAHATKQTPLLAMQQGARLSEKVSLLENTGEGVAPAFQSEGFVRPAQVALIERGALRGTLVSPRSAKEYGLATNAANGRESPEALDLAAGTLEMQDVPSALDRGLYVSNLWYLNYSDRPAGRITGMTRFATFWVEGGRVLAPVAPMRFDDSLYRMLGSSLLDLTRERLLLFDPSTYGERSTDSMRLPGALLGALRFTL